MQTRHDLVRELIDKLIRHESYLSYSAISNFKESPKSFIDYKLKTKEPTDAMVFGTLVHCLILEPDLFEQRYFVIDDAEQIAIIGGAKPRATNAYKEWFKVESSKAEGRIIVEPADYTAAKIMAMTVRTNRAAAMQLKKVTEKEKSIEWELKNFKFRGIIDGDGEIVIDLKTCADASPRKFQRSIVEMDYHIQAALYLKGLGEVKPYYIIAVDKSGGVSVHLLSETLIEHAFKEIDFLLDKFNECIINETFDNSFDFWSERYDGSFLADKPAYLY